MDKLLEKTAQMKETYRKEDQPTIEAWENKIKLLLLKESIAGSDAVKELVVTLNDEVKRMDNTLLNVGSYTLPDYQRDRMLDKKELYTRIASYFDVKGEREDLENLVNSN